MSEVRDPIDASLQRLFAVPELGGLQAKIDAAAAAPSRIDPVRAGRVGMRRLAVAAIAAAAAAVVVLAWAGRGEREREVPELASASMPEDDARRRAGAELVEIYGRGDVLPRTDDDGCVEAPPPPGSCADEGALPQLVVDDTLERIGECGGVGAPSCAGFGVTATRLVHVRLRDTGVDVLVWVEPELRDPQPVLPEDAGLGLFRRELGGFVLYEVTPLSEPRALAHFRL